jgi:phosphomannomutase
MTAVDTRTYPELRQLFGAYLNADFATSYGTVAEALAAYRRETGPGHRSAARAELDRLTAETGAATRLAAGLTALGCEVRLATPGEAWGLAAAIRRALEPAEPAP